MRVVFLEDIPGVARGGEVLEVKNGFARNHLIPKNLAVPATHNALQRVERLKREAQDKRAKTLVDMEALAEYLDGVQVDVEMRAGASGRLYGSVTSAMIAERLSGIAEREIDRRAIAIGEPIRELGIFDIKLSLYPEVEAKVKVVVYASGTDPAAILEAGEAAEAVDAEGVPTETETPDEAEEAIVSEVESEPAAEEAADELAEADEEPAAADTEAPDESTEAEEVIVAEVESEPAAEEAADEPAEADEEPAAAESEAAPVETGAPEDAEETERNTDEQSTKRTDEDDNV